MKTINLNLSKVPKSVYVVLFFQFIILLILYYSRDKGVDLTDEGLYLALAQPSQDNYFAQLNQNLFFLLFFKLTGISFGLEGLRILKFFVLIVSFLSCYPILRYYKVKAFWSVLCFFSLFSNYAYYGQSLSYNTLSFLFYSIFLSLGFCYMFYNRSVYLFLGMGAIVSLAFVSKSTTGLLLFFFGFLFCFVNSIKSYKNLDWLVLILFYMAGFIGVQLFFSIFFENYNFIKVIQNGLELSSYNSAYNKFSLIKSPISAFRWALVLIASGYFIGLSIFSRRNIIKYLSGIFSFLMLYWFFLSHNRLDFYRFYEFSFLFFSYVFIGFSLHNQIQWNSKKILLSILLLISPLIVSFGTFSYHFKSGILYLFFLFLLLAILNNSEGKQTKFINLAVLLIIVMLTVKVFLNVIYMPFKQPRLLGNLKEFTYLYGNKIYLTEDYHLYLRRLNEIFEKHTYKSDKILGVYEMPGDIILAGRYNSLNPWIWVPNHLDFFQKKALTHELLSKVEFVLSKDKVVSSQLFAKEIIVLDSINHPNFGFIYFSKAER